MKYLEQKYNELKPICEEQGFDIKFKLKESKTTESKYQKLKINFGEHKLIVRLRYSQHKSFKRTHQKAHINKLKEIYIKGYETPEWIKFEIEEFLVKEFWSQVKVGE